MYIIDRARFTVPFILALILLAGIPAFAQVDFTGVWAPRVNDEDNPSAFLSMITRASGVWPGLQRALGFRSISVKCTLWNTFIGGHCR